MASYTFYLFTYVFFFWYLSKRNNMYLIFGLPYAGHMHTLSTLDAVCAVGVAAGRACGERGGRMRNLAACCCCCCCAGCVEYEQIHERARERASEGGRQRASRAVRVGRGERQTFVNNKIRFKHFFLFAFYYCCCFRSRRKPKKKAADGANVLD